MKKSLIIIAISVIIVLAAGCAFLFFRKPVEPKNVSIDNSKIEAPVKQDESKPSTVAKQTTPAPAVVEKAVDSTVQVSPDGKFSANVVDNGAMSIIFPDNDKLVLFASKNLVFEAKDSGEKKTYNMFNLVSKSVIDYYKETNSPTDHYLTITSGEWSADSKSFSGTIGLFPFVSNPTMEKESKFKINIEDWSVEKI